MPVFRHIFMILCLSATAPLLAQGSSPEAGGSFFAQQALEDAVFEQLQVFEFEKDESDFWQDQRAYERQLYQVNPSAFGEYVIAKRNAYRAHQPLCDQSCGHGDYYYLQLAYYMQFGDSEGAFLALTDGSGVGKGLREPNRN